MSNITSGAEPARPSNVTSEIDRLVGMTLPGSNNVRVRNDGTTEALSMPENAMSRSGDVAAPPALDDLIEQGEKHAARAAQLNAELAAQVFNRDTGQAIGPRVTGADRELLISQRDQAINEQRYIAHLIESTHEARIAWNEARAAEQAAGATPAVTTLEDAAARENAIRELADMPGDDGRPIGRAAAMREYNSAQLRAKADKLARR